MTARVGRVDHPVVAVHDLDRTSQQYRKLGFVVPPSGKHQEWGTENLCIMFPGDYLEIRGIGDPNKFLAGVDKFLAKGEGLYSVAFNAASAQESYQAGLAAGLEIEPPRHLNRKLVLEDRTLDLHFETVMLGHDLYPGLTHANLCQHLTADTLRQPGWTDHPNGVVAFGRLVGVVSDFDAAAAAYTRLIGAENVTRGDDHILLDFGAGADIELIGPAEAQRRGDAQPQLGDAYLASATLLVKDAAATAALFEANGVRFARQPGGELKVDPADACGAHLYFKQA
ncbi:putative dioxygenase [Bordetella bronchiseptica MO149]|uniref:VOC family protein n=1 Tax=Bordetella bronchiseptica TaxID=518 RepID=UPI00028A4BB8|nr:VOC family protein [Bordetella bronchiseptica]AWQ03422.1 dioxygenase [Bordetella bronchiseptica]CCJ57000.1 putative dioxygenase [Bordetella bronchiseptica MO149]